MRPRIAAAAKPNMIVTGGAGTSTPLVELFEDDVLELVEELVDVLLDVDVLLVILPEVLVLVDCSWFCSCSWLCS